MGLQVLGARRGLRLCKLVAESEACAIAMARWAQLA
jgi:hypothetical protein